MVVKKLRREQPRLSTVLSTPDSTHGKLTTTSAAEPHLQALFPGKIHRSGYAAFMSSLVTVNDSLGTYKANNTVATASSMHALIRICFG